MFMKLQELLERIEAFANSVKSLALRNSEMGQEELEIKDFLMNLDSRTLFYLTGVIGSKDTAELLNMPVKIIARKIMVSMDSLQKEEAKSRDCIALADAPRLKAFFASQTPLAEEEMDLLKEEMTHSHPLKFGVPDFGTDDEIIVYIANMNVREYVYRKQAINTAMSFPPLNAAITAEMERKNVAVR